jgi:ABC-type cobalamin/Fe3+-siderophores transport system ATPase subunit
MEMTPKQQATADKFAEVLSCLDEPLEPVDLARLIAILVVIHDLGEDWDQMSVVVADILGRAQMTLDSMTYRIN